MQQSSRLLENGREFDLVKALSTTTADSASVAGAPAAAAGDQLVGVCIVYFEWNLSNINVVSVRETWGGSTM